MNISIRKWGEMPDGREVSLFTLDNGKGVQVAISNLGGIVQSIIVPDRNGVPGDVVLGFDTPQGYLADASFQGAMIGRYGNRIGNSRFVIDGVTYKVKANEGANCLHGGNPGFNKMLWNASAFGGAGRVGVTMTLLSPDGENGFPGDLMADITFELNEEGELAITYTAETDKATVYNPTHHMYYNLTGDADRDVLDHVLRIDADSITPVNDTLIPTGEFLGVEDTPFDFTNAKAVGAQIDDFEDAQLALAGGYDHNFAFTEWDGECRLQAEICDPESGRFLKILTTEPGVQFYSANGLSAEGAKGGKSLQKRHAFCLETQHFPDSPNKPEFPSTELRPGEKFYSRTVLCFGAE